MQPPQDPMSPPPGGNPYVTPNLNPYAPPQAAPQIYSVAPGPNALPGAHVALFNANQVALATFLGTIFSGSILMAINEHRAGHKGRVWPTLAIGFLATAVIIGIAFVLPANVPGMPITIATIVGMRAMATKMQGPWVTPHLTNGGKKASGWAAFGIGMAGLAIAVGIIMIVAIAGAFGHLDE